MQMFCERPCATLILLCDAQHRNLGASSGRLRRRRTRCAAASCHRSNSPASAALQAVIARGSPSRQFGMHRAAPRPTCFAPPALLHSLRLRAACLTSGSVPAAVAPFRHGRSGPPVAAAVAAAAAGRPPGRVATSQLSSRAVEAHRLLGFRALDLSSVPPKELGIVDDVRLRSRPYLVSPPPSATRPFCAVQAELLLVPTALVVPQVLSIAETGQAQPLLHVRAAGDPRQPEDALREEHLIPYVPEIVPTVDLRSGAACGRA